MNASEKSIFVRLLSALQQYQPKVDRFNNYYDGAQRLEALGLAIPPEMECLATVINWPGLVVDAFEERLDIDGFRLAKAPSADETLWDWWQYNDMDEQSSLAHVEALVTGRAFVTVSYNEEDPDIPRIVAEPARSMITETDPRTGKVIAALRVYDVDCHDPTTQVYDYGRRMIADRATLYLPNVTRYLRRTASGWGADPDIEDHKHRLGVVPVVPIANRARLANRFGRSEFERVMGLTDAACRSLTNLQAAQELMALPQRYVFGVEPDDFVDPNTGETIPTWEAYLGRILAFSAPDGKAGEFQAASLDNFHSTINTYARHGAALTGLPLRYFGVVSEANPAGADAIVADESRMIKRAERIARGFSSGWEQVMRVGMMITEDESNKAARLETVWRDPSTHTKSALSDAAVKLYQARSDEGPLLPRAAVWEQLGYGPEARDRLREQFDEDLLAQALRLAGEPDDGSRPVAEGATADNQGTDNSSTAPAA